MGSFLSVCLFICFWFVLVLSVCIILTVNFFVFSSYLSQGLYMFGNSLKIIGNIIKTYLVRSAAALDSTMYFKVLQICTQISHFTLTSLRY